MRGLIPTIFREDIPLSNLPFLKKKPMGSGLLIQNREPDEPKDEQNHGLMSAAQDIISAIEHKDHRMLASALQAAYDICASSPQDESADQLDNGEQE